MSIAKWRNPFLIQRATIRPGYAADAMMKDFVSLDYMGAAEFEFGAVPQAYRDYHDVLDELVVASVDLGRSPKVSGPIWYTCVRGAEQDAAKFLALAKPPSRMPLKEYIGLAALLESELRPWATRDNFWFSLGHDRLLAFALDRASVEHFPKAIRASVAYMNERQSR